MDAVLLRTSFVLTLASCLAGCGGGPATPDARPRADAHIPNYSCADQPPPDPLPDTITLHGVVYQPGIPGVSPDEPQPNTLIRAYEVGTDRLLSTTVSQQDGTYELVTAGESQPIDTYLTATNALFLETRLFPPRPPAEDVKFDIPLFNFEDRDRVQKRAQVKQEGTLAFVIIGVIDCDYFPVDKATVSSTPQASDTIYQDDLGFPHPVIESTSHEGFAFLFNVPPGEITVNAHKDGRDFRPVTARVQRWTSGIIWGIGIAP